MARAAKKESVDVLVEKALDRGLSDTKDIIAAVLKAKPSAKETSIQSRLSAVRQKRGVGRIRRASSVPGGQIDSEAVLIFILRQGGVEKAKASLAKLQDDPVLSFAVAAGGIKAAKKAVEAAESKVSSVAI